MYLEHFGLDEQPFRITPHTDFFFDGADRGTTLDALVYAVLHDEGIVKVSGEVGSGKTMLCRVLLERLPETVETVYLANPSLTRDELLHSIADELQISIAGDGTRVAMRELFEHLISLYAQGRRVVILIDEAHAMPDETLEQVRLLSNLESSRHKLLQMVLFGQPELDETLAKVSMRQLKDRITHSFRMRPLSEAEIATYLSFRMRAAGYRGPDVFTPKAIAMIAAASSGLSRRINILADKSLLAAFAEGGHAIGEREVRAAIRDSEFATLRKQPALEWRPYVLAAIALVAGLGIGLGLHRAFRADDVPAAAPRAAAASTPVVPAVPTTAIVPAAAVTPGEATSVSASTAPPSLAIDQIRLFDAYPVGAHPLARERLSATRRLLEREPDHHYSLELYTTDNWDPARLEGFFQRARDMVPLDELFVIPSHGPQRFRIRVVYGAYSTRESARLAQARLPPRYKQAFQTELRSFAELRGSVIP
jgi:MSHA biogenesis protein MshM